MAQAIACRSQDTRELLPVARFALRDAAAIRNRWWRNSRRIGDHEIHLSARKLRERQGCDDGAVAIE